MHHHSLRLWIVLGLALAPGALEGQRLYRLEAGLSGGYHLYDEKTALASSPGGAARLGYWLAGPFSLEVEGTTARPKSDTPLQKQIRVTNVGGWLLTNLRLGTYHSAFLKGGYAHVSFGRCPAVATPGDPACGAADVVQAGAGLRIALSPTVLLRYDADVSRSITTIKFTNMALQGGLSLMIGSRPLRDADGDGVFDRKDRCPGTRLGALVDHRGCPTDQDRDGVSDGIDRCPTTVAGAEVDDAGCPRDSDGDGLLDGIDQCPDTPDGAQVDAQGCPSDADSDGVPDGLDRCPMTPAGAAVDRLGCASDADADGVPDGLDRCPGTATGVAVDAEGCSGPRPGGRVATPRSWVLPGTVWQFRSAVLGPEAAAVLDSVAAVLKADTTAMARVNGFAHDRLVPRDNLRLSQRRAEVVREQLLRRGVQGDRVSAIGRGAESLLVEGESDQARVANRRVEIEVLPGPGGM